VIAPALPALADLSRRTKFRITGADRVRFLNGQVSNDVRRASPHASVYSCVMTIKGKMCADAFIYAGDDALFLDAEPDVREALAARLERYIIADDVTLEDVTDDFGLWHLFPFLGEPAAAADACRLLAGPAIHGVHWVSSTRYGQPGIDFWGAMDARETLRAQLLASYSLLDGDALRRRRILAGVPAWGAELDENTMPAEAGLEERAVSYTKGCYIGQEVVSRVRSLGHVNRQLRGLRSQTGHRLSPGLRLYPLTGNADGRDVGRITSVARSVEDEGASIALAFLRRGWETAGTVLAARPALAPDPVAGSLPPAAAADVPGDECQVMVCELPLT
jgi:folate-binding protein YgfZ